MGGTGERRRTWDVVNLHGQHEGIVQAYSRDDAQQELDAATA
jgi:hypothetical protein